MCYKACFYNGGHRRKKTDTLIIFARAYRDGKRKEPIRKQQTENKKRRKRSKSEGQPDTASQGRARNGQENSYEKRSTIYTTHTSEFSKAIATAEKLQERKSREECPYSSTRQPESECKIHKEDYIFCTSPSTAHTHLIIII